MEQVVGPGGGRHRAREPVNLSPSPATVSFGNVPVGSTGTAPVVLTNSSTTNIVLVQSQLSGTGFAVSGLNLPMNLQAKQTVSFNVTFTPQSRRISNGSLVLPNASIDDSVEWNWNSKNARDFVVQSRTSVNFGDVNVGSTGTQAMSLVATGRRRVTITFLEQQQFPVRDQWRVVSDHTSQPDRAFR